MSEIALAGARKIKLKLIAEGGDSRALDVLALQENSADFLATSQIGLNAIAILGGILGEGAFRPYFAALLAPWLDPKLLDTVAFILRCRKTTDFRRWI